MEEIVQQFYEELHEVIDRYKNHISVSRLIHISQDVFHKTLSVKHNPNNNIQWHDLRRDKNDLPDDCRSVWTNVGAGYHDDDGWWDDFGRLQNVIAWCEPKFEEIQNV